MAKTGRETRAENPGHPDVFILAHVPHARETSRTYQLNGRPCTDWERPVLDRAYARLEQADALLVTVVGR